MAVAWVGHLEVAVAVEPAARSMQLRQSTELLPAVEGEERPAHQAMAQEVTAAPLTEQMGLEVPTLNAYLRVVAAVVAVMVELPSSIPRLEGLVMAGWVGAVALAMLVAVAVRQELGTT